jgi:Holliday junction DNA helicase RuvA
MIGYLKGTVIALKHQELWLDVSGVGYRIKVGAYGNTPVQSEIQLFIHTAVREDAITLYGFSTMEELELFELLISVSGIGPKTGMDIVGAASGSMIEQAIREADVGFFSGIKGIGKKSAQRIIIDLKNKIGSLKDIDLSQNEEADAVFLALKQFGFKPGEIYSVLNQIDRTTSEQAQIKAGLKLLGKGQPSFAKGYGRAQ